MPGGRSLSSCFPSSASSSPDPGRARILATVPYMVPPFAPSPPGRRPPSSALCARNAAAFRREGGKQPALQAKKFAPHRRPDLRGGRLLGLLDQAKADRLAHG